MEGGQEDRKRSDLFLVSLLCGIDMDVASPFIASLTAR